MESMDLGSHERHFTGLRFLVFVSLLFTLLFFCFPFSMFCFSCPVVHFPFSGFWPSAFWPSALYLLIFDTHVPTHVPLLVCGVRGIIHE
ncbi:hypothetical protein F5B19DRAFT_366033 [Rostrohypoxylon terebratum]|nr:hypothetical protein F5B19DRAFT_366033 [Rostrohypoxylon terebratum]